MLCAQESDQGVDLGLEMTGVLTANAEPPRAGQGGEGRAEGSLRVEL